MKHPPPYSNSSTRSLPCSRFREPETQEIRQPRSKQSCSPVRPRRPERDESGPLGLNYEYECARKQLSEFNESLPGRQLTCVKYEWTNLVPDKQEKSHSGLSRVGSENGNLESKTRLLCNVENPTLLSRRYHLGVHGIEVFLDNELSCYKQEKKPVFDSNDAITHTLQSKDCVKTNPSSVSLRDYFNMIYSDVGLSRVNDSVPDDGYGFRSTECLETINMAGVTDNVRPGNSMKGSIVDSIIDKSEVDHAYRDDTREGWMLDNHGGCDQYQNGEYSGHRSFNVSQGSQDMEIVGEYSGSGGFLVEHGLDVNLDDGSVQVGEVYGFERDGGSGSYEEVLVRLPNSEFDEVLYENKDGPQEMLEAEELGIQELSRNRVSYNDIYDLHTDELVKPSSFDIKKRLGPAQNLKKRLGHSGRPFIKKRPGSLSFKIHEQNKLSRTNLDDFNDVLGDDLLDVNMKWSKMEPLEDSERFEQLVQNAFLRFVKALYDNPAQQSKFTKQGGMSTLQCSVCCSNSKGFVGTPSLLQHAFMCRRAGLRAEHLGFHKAVCVLMGWSYEATPNGYWVQQTLSNAEALAVKEDLIIWPPVVFVHNSSIVNAKPDQQMIISIEKLKAVIKGMGFDQGITKVCRGKAANQSILVVNFQGTLSGLQEAERLHKHYAEDKHGRYEFQQIASRSSCTSDESQNKDKIKSFLYGYLGIIEDLDKLDFMTKKRCVVKSKKEIHTIVGGPS